MEIWIFTLASAALVSAVSLVGGVGLLLREEFLRKIVTVLVGLAVGVLLGDVFIHLLPESLSEIQSPRLVSALILLGIFLFFALEKFVKWQHHHVVSQQDCDLGARSCAHMCLVGDAVHNFTDGMIIASSFLVSPVVGLTTTVAVIAHEIPQELSDVGVLFYGGYSTRRAVWLNYLCSLTVIPGALLTLLLSGWIDGVAVYLLPIAAGGFIYIAASDLIPQLQHKSPLRIEFAQTATMAVGVLLMAGVILLEERLEQHAKLADEAVLAAPRGPQVTGAMDDAAWASGSAARNDNGI
ncbi:MAG: ZIP family metal transporter [Deltaproteobacteria bacterium]|nr:ZIP family metal transporter [Deltaproteobacteria bacterium]